MFKKTKSALALGILAIVLCMGMLVGTTYAWFTDSVESGSNVITAGNLDLEVEYTLNGKDWKVLDDAKDLFQNDLWEPGHTEVVVLKVTNAGSLALKYSVNMGILSETFGKNAAGEDIVLSDILEVSTLTIAEAGVDPLLGINIAEKTIEKAFESENAIAWKEATSFKNASVVEAEENLLSEEAHYVLIKVDMPETVGNEANHDGVNVPTIEFGINVYAAQYAYEKDSFGPDYDADAELPTIVYNDKELNDAIVAGETTINLSKGVYVLPASAQGKTLHFVGTGEDTVIATNTSGSYEGCNYALDGSTVVFENITINTDSKTYTGYARADIVFKNCTINGCITLYGETVFENCEFNIAGDKYNVWTWGAPTATFNNCTFNSDGKALLLYGQANTVLTVNNCTFNDNGGLADLKAAIEIGNDYNKSYTLYVNNTVVNGYEINDKGINTGTTLGANKNSMPQEKLNVVVDGVDVY